MPVLLALGNTARVSADFMLALGATRSVALQVEPDKFLGRDDIAYLEMKTDNGNYINAGQLGGANPAAMILQGNSLGASTFRWRVNATSVPVSVIGN